MYDYNPFLQPTQETADPYQGGQTYDPMFGFGFRQKQPMSPVIPSMLTNPNSFVPQQYMSVPQQDYFAPMKAYQKFKSDGDMSSLLGTGTPSPGIGK